jgi:hypothetical protein
MNAAFFGLKYFFIGYCNWKYVWSIITVINWGGKTWFFSLIIIVPFKIFTGSRYVLQKISYFNYFFIPQRMERLKLESDKKGEEDDEYECHVCSANLYLSLVSLLPILYVNLYLSLVSFQPFCVLTSTVPFTGQFFTILWANLYFSLVSLLTNLCANLYLSMVRLLTILCANLYLYWSVY